MVYGRFTPGLVAVVRAMPDADVVLEVVDLQKSFGAITAAADLNIRFFSEQTVGIIGANGAGKTTFVNLVTGYLKPSQGEIRYLGRDITGLNSREVTLAGLCRSFQIPQVFTSMTVQENLMMAVGIAEAGYLPGLGRLATLERRAVAEEILVRYRLESYRDRLAALLPQGIRKLLDIAMAMARKPTVLMLDEPTSGISAAEKFALMDLVMTALKTQSVTVLFIEHDMEIVERYAARVLAFYNGRIIADGPPRQVLQDKEVREYVIGTSQSPAPHKTLIPSHEIKV